MVTDGLQESFSRSTTCEGKQKKNKIDLYTLNVLFSVRYINIVKMLIKSVNMERYLVIHIHR